MADLKFRGLFFFLFAFFQLFIIVALGKFLIINILIQKLIQLFNIHVALYLSKLIDYNVQPLQIFVNTRFGFTGGFLA